MAAPEAAGYELQSHGIIEMLEKLLDKFINERTETEKKEMNSKHAFEMLMQDLTAQIKQATTGRGEKAEITAKSCRPRQVQKVTSQTLGRARRRARNICQIWSRHANRRHQTSSPDSSYVRRRSRPLPRPLRSCPVRLSQGTLKSTCLPLPELRRSTRLVALDRGK